MSKSEYPANYAVVKGDKFTGVLEVLSVKLNVGSGQMIATVEGVVKNNPWLPITDNPDIT